MTAKTDQATRGNDKLQINPAAAPVDQVGHTSLPGGQFFRQDPDKFLRYINEQALNGFQYPAFFFPGDDLGPGHHALIPFPAHGFDQHRHLQFPAAADFKGVLPFQRLEPEGHVFEGLLLQAVSQVTGGEILSLFAREGSGVHIKNHRNGRLVDVNPRKRKGTLQGRDRVADIHGFHAGKGDNVAGFGTLHCLPLQALKCVQSGKADSRYHVSFTAEGIAPVHLQNAVHQSADGELSHIGVIIEIGHQKLRRCFVITLRTGDPVQDRLKQGLQIGGIVTGLPMGDTGLGVGVKNGEFNLSFIGVEVNEQVIDLVENFLYAGVAPVDLVNNQDDGKLSGQGLLHNKTRLGERPLAGIDQEDHSVHHVEAPLHFTAEIGMTGRVDDIDFHVVVPDGCVLRHDGDPTFFFQVHRIHHPFHHDLMCPEGAGLPEHGIEQGGFAVIDMRNDGNISDI